MQLVIGNIKWSKKVSNVKSAINTQKANKNTSTSTKASILPKIKNTLNLNKQSSMSVKEDTNVAKTDFKIEIPKATTKAIETTKTDNVLPTTKKTNVEIPTNETVTNNEVIKTLDTQDEVRLNNLKKLDTTKMTEVQKTEINNEIETLENKKIETKKEQLKVINNSNPMTDDYHTGIRNTEDILTSQEAYKEASELNTEYGEMTYPDTDISIWDNAIKTGEITVYSSTPIENGNFISISEMEAKEYAGNEKNLFKYNSFKRYCLDR